MRVYLDAAPVIYLIENVLPFADTVEAYLSRAGVELVASDLTRVHEIVPLSRDVMDQATEIRARLGFRTTDAIHVAAALAAGCDVFLTNDHRLSRSIGIKVEVIEV